MHLFKFTSRRNSNTNIRHQQRNKKTTTTTAAASAAPKADHDAEPDDFAIIDFHRKYHGDSVPTLVTCEDSEGNDSQCGGAGANHFEEEGLFSQDSISDMMPMCQLLSSTSGCQFNNNSDTKVAAVIVDLTDTETAQDLFLTTEEQQQQALTDIEKALGRLEQLDIDLKRDLYHKNRIMTLRVKTENPPSAVQVMSQIISVEAQRERILRASYALQQFEMDLQQQQQSPQPACESKQQQQQQPPPSPAARLRHILSVPPPRASLTNFAELYMEAEVRVEAQRLLWCQRDIEDAEQVASSTSTQEKIISCTTTLEL